MKKILLVVLCLQFAVGLFADSALEGSVVTNNNVDPIIKKDHEISINVFGVFIGSYTAQFEFVPSGDGLFTLGAKGTVNDIKIDSDTLSGFQALAVARLYPARYMRGFYIMAEGGYASSSAEDENGVSTNLTSVPLLAGLGWKWVINEFSIDAGLAYGKQIYLTNPDQGVVDINSFPFNIAFDSYLLVGYRF